jgi:hypothetical protein
VGAWVLASVRARVRQRDAFSIARNRPFDNFYLLLHAGGRDRD